MSKTTNLGKSGIIQRTFASSSLCSGDSHHDHHHHHHHHPRQHQLGNVDEEEEDEAELVKVCTSEMHYDNKSSPVSNYGNSPTRKSHRALIPPSHKSYEDDPEEDFDVDLPSDLPSGLVDIEGNIIGTIRLGQEEGEEEDEFGAEDLDNLDEEIRLSQARKLSVISNGRVFTHGRGYHLHNHCHRHAGVNRDNSTSAQSNSSTSTITQHYYPEGGWGWVVLLTASLCHVLLCGLKLCVGLMIWAIINRFGVEVQTEAGLLGACSVGISLFLSPVWIAICKRKSTRLTAVFGGLVASLGCLFTSFATQFHQVFFSYSIILGVGVGLTRDASSLMVGQYFKRKRDVVEIVVVGASGLGILLMSILINNAINSLGWRLGLQAITGTIFVCFFLGTCYRSASLYHPQRRAILHLKNQKRKVKEKERRDDKPPFIDFGCLRSKTVQILLISSAFSAFGIYTPIFYLAIDNDNDPSAGELLSISQMYIYVGATWILGCIIFGAFVVQKSKDCRVSKQYLCQISSAICGFAIITFTLVKGQSGLITFCCLYGFSLGGYSYALKIYTYERVRARHFPRAWSFIQSSQAIPIFVGVPLTGYLNDAFPGWRSGYYLSAAGVFAGAICLFLTNVRRRRLSRRKSQNSSKISTKTCETTTATTTTTSGGASSSASGMTKSQSSPKLRRLSFAFPVEQISPEQKHEPVMICDSNGKEEAEGSLDPSVLVKELTCISEEAIAEMDFQEIDYGEWEDFLGGECITSCGRVEDCLVSEFQPDGAIQAGSSSGLLHNHFPKGKYFHRPAKGLGPLVTAAAVARSVASMGTKLPLTANEPPSDPLHGGVEASALLLSTHSTGGRSGGSLF